MDTNRNNGQNYQINAFNKGMNTDTALDAVDEGQYIFGLNIRIANNALLIGNIDPNSKEGLVTPVEAGVSKNLGMQTVLLLQEGETIDRILATASIGNTGVVIFARKFPQIIQQGQEPVDTNEAQWLVYRIDNEPTGFVSNLLYASNSLTTKDKFSVVINKEQEDIIKLYIADGEHGIMQLFVKNENVDLTTYYSTLTEDDLVSGKYFPIDKAVITGTTSGQLKTQQVQYTYRFYKRFGIFSKLAPLTNKIQVIDANRDVEQGNAENTTTSIGFCLSIPLDSLIKQMFDHIQLIRVSYVVAGQVPEIEIVKDVKLPTANVQTCDIVDTGEDPLEELSLDEFQALNTLSIIPNSIESSQGYLFAANVKDKTTFYVTPGSVLFNLNFVIGNLVVESDLEIKNDDNIIYQSDILTQSSVGGVTRRAGLNDQLLDVPMYFQQALPDEQEVVGEVENESTSPTVAQGIIENIIAAQTAGLSVITNVVPEEQQNQGEQQALSSIMTIKSYLESCGIKKADSDTYKGYSDMFVSSMCRSLRHGESYLYGVVLYKKDGTHSDVLEVTLIDVPSEKDLPAWRYANGCLYALPIGLIASVTVTNIPDVVGYEVVRVLKAPNSSKVLLTSVLSRPVNEQLTLNDAGKYTPSYPQGFLNICNTEIRTNAVLQSDLRQYTGVQDINVTELTKYFTTEEIELYLRTKYGQAGPWTNPQQSLLDAMSLEEPPKSNELYIIEQLNNKRFSEYQSQVSNYLRPAVTSHVENIVQTFAPEILYKRKDMLTMLSNSSIEACPVYNVGLIDYPEWVPSVTTNPMIIYAERITPSDYSKKPTTHTMFDYVKRFNLQTDLSGDYDLTVKRIKDVKNPLWNQGFAQIDTNSSDSKIVNGVKQYKTYNTSIGMYEYINWICNAMYDLPISAEEADNDSRFTDVGINDRETRVKFRVYNDAVHKDFETTYGSSPHWPKDNAVLSPIGPGPICLLTEFNKDGGSLSCVDYVTIESTNLYLPATVVVNIINKSFENYTEDQKLYTPYYGFGNFGKLSNGTGSLVMFDGDAYVTMCEFVTMFKTYDFKSLNDTLISNQYICRVPMETSINTYFDYGMNYRNTQNKNLQLEPGTITNVTTQDRPLHQYNAVYSDNHASVLSYVAQQLDTHTDSFPQRIYYSQHKDNGEQIESWNIFKPVDYIDADTRYGEITNLLSANDMIYFWQDRAFGKLSVNERSLVTDNNNNTIQLGQGGVLQRTDYLSTKYGMRPEDYSAINTEQGLFWIDILNKAIVANTKDGVVNYGEQLNVQNLINKRMSDNKPEIDYDLQNSELLCKCFKDGDQLVFNIKYNIATSVYTRDYDKVLYFNNVMYALKGYNTATQLNYLNVPGENEESLSKLSPTILLFVVNSNPSLTKVFDNLKIVVAAKDWETPYTQQLEFKTDVNSGTSNVSLGWLLDNPLPFGRVTDREANICYAVPRETTTDSHPQLRMRGKWMTVKITDNNPKKDFAISHIITKFRQSYS